MTTATVFCTLIALLFPIATAPAAAGTNPADAPPAVAASRAPATQPAGADRGGELAALEQKLLGVWKGGACVGDFTFHADGTYELRNFTPGNNTLAGTWSLRWDALPPTLVVTCKTSDFKTHDPTRHEYEYFGKSLEVKLVELRSDALVLRFPADKKVGFASEYTERYERRVEE